MKTKMNLQKIIYNYSNYKLYKNIFPFSVTLKILPSIFIHNKNGIAPPPVIACYLATNKCNVNCDFCNIKYSNKNSNKDLSVKELDNIANFFKIFAIGGGEPFCRKDMPLILNTLSLKNVKTLTVTNGLLFNDNVILEVMHSEPEILMFSILGDETLHDKKMNKIGAYKQVILNLNKIISMRKKTKIIINCTVDHDNIEHFLSVANLGKNIGVDAVRFTLLSFFTYNEVKKSIKQGFSPSGYILNKNQPLPEVKKITEVISILKNKYANFISFHPYTNKKENNLWFKEFGGIKRHCHFIWNSLFLKPDGTVVPCGNLLNYEFGNIRTKTIEEIWNGNSFVNFRKKLINESLIVCSRCCKV